MQRLRFRACVQLQWTLREPTPQLLRLLACSPACCRELQGIAAVEVEAQLAYLSFMRPGGTRRKRLPGETADTDAALVGGTVECLVQAYALQGVPFGSDAAARQALVDTLRGQVQVSTGRTDADD